MVDAGGVDVVDAPTPVDAPDVPSSPTWWTPRSAPTRWTRASRCPGLDVAPDAAAVDAPDVQLADVVDAAGCDAALAVDPLNCGTCGNVCAGGTAIHDGALPVRLRARCVCDGRCVDTRTNNSNCGACGNACTIANTVCSVGRCACRGAKISATVVAPISRATGRTVARAEPDVRGLRAAFQSARIADVTSGATRRARQLRRQRHQRLRDRPQRKSMHCGGCGMACSTAGRPSTCATGRCVIQCNPGFANCDGTPSNGCEININTSVAHCGSCGGWCSPRHATPSCTDGRCGISACDRNYADCDGDVANGCEVPIDFSNTNCGRCGRVVSKTAPHASAASADKPRPPSRAARRCSQGSTTSCEP